MLCNILVPPSPNDLEIFSSSTGGHHIKKDYNLSHLSLKWLSHLQIRITQLEQQIFKKIFSTLNNGETF